MKAASQGFPLPLLAVLALVPDPAFAADHILITEFAVRPTEGEFIEIFNPTGNIVDLSQYFLSDYVLASDPLNNYWHVVDDGLQPDPAFPNDFLAHFPEGTTIAPGETIVISLGDDAAFSGNWSTAGVPVLPDFELRDDGTADGIPSLVDPGPDLIGEPFVLSSPGLSNDREVFVLFTWDFESDLVRDVDIVQWSNAGPNFNTLSPNKSGVIIDSAYDGDTVTSTYLPDTAPQGQDLASTATGGHDFGRTISRADFQEGTETQTGGNGLLGHDETSENYSDTWVPNTTHSIGSPGPFGPPTLTRAEALAATEVEVLFSRAVDPATAASKTNYNVLQIETPGGQIVSAALPVRSAVMGPSGTSVILGTDPQVPRALYEVTASSSILSLDLAEPLVGERRAFFRGANERAGVRLEVPHNPFVPHLDGQMEITYIAPQGEAVRLRVYDSVGREVFVMLDEEAPPGGVRTIRWDGRDDLRQELAPGLYLLHLEVSATGDRTVAPVVVAAAAEGTLR